MELERFQQPAEYVRSIETVTVVRAHMRLVSCAIYHSGWKIGDISLASCGEAFVGHLIRSPRTALSPQSPGQEASCYGVIDANTISGRNNATNRA